MRLVVRDRVHYESVLSVFYDNTIYTAPVGFRKKGEFIEVKIYKNSMLSRVVLSRDIFVLNITIDPVYIIKTTFKKEFNYEKDIVKDFVIRDELPYLKNSIGYIVIEKDSIVDRGEYLEVRYKIRSIVENEQSIIEPYTRCYSALIELAIHGSKIKSIEDTRRRCIHGRRALLALEIIDKTCVDEYRDLAKEIKVLIERWLRES